MEEFKVSYVLNAKNVEDCFKIARSEKKKKTKKIIETIIFVFFGGLWMYSFIVAPKEFMSLALGVICGVFALLLWYLPYKNMKDIASVVEKEALESYMIFSDDRIYFNDNKDSFIEMNSSVQFFETNEIFMIDTLSTQVYALPKRCLKENEEEKVREYIKAYAEDRFFDLRK